MTKRTGGIDRSEIVSNVTPAGPGYDASGRRPHKWYPRKGKTVCADCHLERREDGRESACLGPLGRQIGKPSIKPHSPPRATEPDGLVHYGTSGLIPNPICNKAGGPELVKRVYVNQGITCKECQKILAKRR